MTSFLYQPPLAPGISGAALGYTPNYAPTKNPHFSIGNQFIPRNLHDVIRWVRFITAQSPVTTEVLRKLATFPITSFTYNSDNPAVRAKFEKITKSFSLKTVLHDIGFQYYTLGNVFISLYLPIHRSLTCNGCDAIYSTSTAEFIEFRGFKFQGVCPKCNTKCNFTHSDTKSTNIEDMNIIIWDPLNIAVNHNPISGKSKYYYKIPNEIKRQIEAGNMLYLESVPWEMVEAIKNKKDFEFAPNMLFHLKNVDTGFSADGISIPPLVSHFNLVFYQATLRRANESIATDYLAPLRVIYPQAQTGNSDPVITTSMRNFVTRMEDALISHKQDNNHVVIAPMPIGYQAISGEGKTLLVSQEIQQAEDSLLLSLGVSRELLTGTTNWTSSTVGLRMLKNTLDSYVGQILNLLEWVSDQTGEYLGIGGCQIGMVPFQLTDDDNLKQIFLQLAEQNQVSMTTLFEAMGRSYDEEQERILEDAKSNARMKIRMEWEVSQAQYAEGLRINKELGPDTSYLDALNHAQEVVAELQQMDPTQANQVINQLKIQDYAKYILVATLLAENNQVEFSGAIPVPGQDDEEDQAQHDRVIESKQRETDAEAQKQGGSASPAKKSKSSDNNPKKPEKIVS